MSTLPSDNQDILADSIKALLGEFASALKTIDNSVPVNASKKYVLAGDELSAKKTTEFLQAMGIPETVPERNALLQFAKLTATSGEADVATLSDIPGPTKEVLSAVHQLKTLLENGLVSISNRKKKMLRNQSSIVVRQIIPMLEGDEFAIKFVHNLAALGILTSASWLVWSSKEKGWKVGSWGVLVMGFIRVLGNLLYNDYDVVTQTWNMAYVHVGLGSVGYALEISKRAGYTPKQDAVTTLRNFLLTLIPVGAFYFKTLWSAGENLVYKHAHKHSDRASSEDVNLLRPILTAFQSYNTEFKNALSANEPGNRTKTVALNVDAPVDHLCKRLKLDVDPDTQRTWRETFMLLAYRAATHTPSILYALFTGLFLLIAARNDPQALSDASALALIFIIELVMGVSDQNTTPDTLAYRMILLSLGRFFSIFFYAAPKIHHLIHSGVKRNLFNDDPQLAAELAHLNAFCFATFGLAVIPSFKLFVTGSKWAFKKAAIARQRQHALELERQAAEAVLDYPVTRAMLGNLWEEDEEGIEDERGNVPDLLDWSEDSHDSEEIEEQEIAPWKKVFEDFTTQCVMEMSKAADEGKQTHEGENTSFISMAAAMGAFGYSNEMDPQLMTMLDKYF